MQGRVHLSNVEKICTKIAPISVGEEKANIMCLVNYQIKDGHEALVAYMGTNFK